MIYKTIVTENTDNMSNYLKDKIHNVFNDYYYGKISINELIHMVQIITEYHTPSNWSYNDMKRGKN